MDYIFFSAVVYAGLLTIVSSYDIACQWIKYLAVRMTQMPEHLHITANIIPKIPKFHFEAHGKKNHTQYSFAFTPGVGRTCGEGIERQWSGMKDGAGQTIEMGPGARRDTLDDFCGFSNWRKTVGLRESFKFNCIPT